ncbi:MAG: ATP/GTP-binding protein [Methanomassiliicoccaceae archaeon]|nr:ATP/GTP-binding protein [Methanomassiliicoccaceae archaeon]
MLIRFKVGNFLSFDETQELSMIRGSTHGHPDHVCGIDGLGLLKVSAVYGANASGKSNLVKAIGESRNMILLGEMIRSDRYFRPKLGNKDLNSYFEFEFEIDSTFYSYGFEVLLSKQRVISEWLYELSEQNRIIFQRTGNVITHEFENDDKTRMDIYVEDMEEASATLFLTEMSRKMRVNEKKLSIFSKISDWFRYRLHVISPGRSLTVTGGEDLNRAAELMASFGTGIMEIGYSKADENEEIFPNGFLTKIHEELIRKRNKRVPNDKCGVTLDMGRGRYRISLSENDEIVIERMFFLHKSSNARFELHEESDGTRRLYDLISVLLNPADSLTYVMDELDLRLHPNLTYKFIERFFERMRGRNNQLIFTVHESSLMDFKLLRRDEIWFIEKGEEESSILYSLEEFNERTDKRIDKAYLEGRYGGVPIFSTVFPCREDK